MPHTDHVTTALYPGSFDPFHNGHLEIVERAARLFDRVVVAAMRNPQKGEPLFSLDERRAMLEESLAHLPNVEITSLSKLVVDVARDVGASIIVKGLRAVSDFEYEFQMALMNRQLWPEIETIFLAPDTQYSFLSASLVREIASLGGDVSEFVPPLVLEHLRKKLA
jgi:pantetheine-phosphate adenylyltransferase